MESIEYKKISAFGFYNGNKYYIYDRYSNNVFQVSYIIYKYLDDFLKLPPNESYIKFKEILSRDSIDEIYDDISYFQNELNSLKSFEIPQLNISKEEEVDRKLNEKISYYIPQLLLNTTEDCNLRCEYCIYSGKYEKSREHNSKNDMTWKTAKKAVNYFFKHNKKASQKSIAFYGGEPLLNFKIIRDIVDYTSSIDTNVIYAITTNGTLLEGKILEYLVNNNFKITISLDGPKEIHDKNRKNIHNDGTFDIIMKNLDEIRNKYPEYFKNKLRFNITLSPYKDIQNILIDFFNFDRFPSIKDLDNFKVNYVNSNDNTYFEESDYIKWLKNYHNEFSSSYVNKHIKGIKNQMDIHPIFLTSQLHREMVFFHYRNMSPINDFDFYWPNGICIPGLRSLFVSPKGDYYACEKLYDIDDMIIGNVNEGVDTTSIRKELNNYSKEINQLCKSCWAFRLCGECWTSARNNNRVDKSERKKICIMTKRHWKQVISDYVTIIENNPNAFSYVDEQKRPKFMSDMIE